jgi:phosphoribosyl 1,2-cyclic phosphodiesterase
MTINILSLASGSTGNCYSLSDGKSSLLIECGIPIARIKQGLNFKLHEVSGCLATHSHQDHSKSVYHILKAGIPVFMSMPCAEELGVFHDHGIRIIYRDKWYTIGSFCVQAFATIHDGKTESDWNTLGFYIKHLDSDERILFCTDSAYIRPRFKGLTRILIECNYSEDRITENLNNGSLDPGQYKRILATHMGLTQCVKFLKSNDLTNLKEIYLIHLSSGNSDEELILKTIRQVAGVPVICCAE